MASMCDGRTSEDTYCFRRSTRPSAWNSLEFALIMLHSRATCLFCNEHHLQPGVQVPSTTQQDILLRPCNLLAHIAQLSLQLGMSCCSYKLLRQSMAVDEKGSLLTCSSRMSGVLTQFLGPALQFTSKWGSSHLERVPAGHALQPAQCTSDDPRHKALRCRAQALMPQAALLLSVQGSALLATLRQAIRPCRDSSWLWGAELASPAGGASSRARSGGCAAAGL